MTRRASTVACTRRVMTRRAGHVYAKRRVTPPQGPRDPGREKHMCVFSRAFGLCSVSICQIVPPIAYPKGNTYICLMLAPWVPCYTSRKSWPQGSILCTHQDDIFAGIRTFACNSKGFSTFLKFHIPDPRGTCPASHPSGNQVDGLPQVTRRAGQEFALPEGNSAAGS